MDVVRRNALKKFTDRCPNLAVVIDDLRVTTVGLPNLAELVEREFANPAHDPDDPEDVFTYERLGGVLFLHPVPENSQVMYYSADFVENPWVLPQCTLPSPVLTVFSGMREETRMRIERKYADRPSIFDIVRRKQSQSPPGVPEWMRRR
jgi:hypothetical protein